MIGGLLKSSSKLALMAAAGILVGGVTMGSAKAADLGGDCCADLEERVAELEATTARKGNRKVSLTVSGQVSRSVLWFDDSITNTSRTYAGVENHNASTRFIFSGTAKITSSVTAGFEFMTELTGGARTSAVSATSVDGGNNGDGLLAVRTANWYLQDKTLGRVTVGRLNLGGPVGTIDLGGIAVGAQYAPLLVGNGFLSAGAINMGSYYGPVIGADRGEGIRWDSASFAGLTLQATWAEQDVWTVAARYAGEFSGVRVAAGIGYADHRGALSQGINGGLDTTATRARNEWSASLALMHVPSGIFAQGQYSRSHYVAGALTSAGATSAQTYDASYWLVQAGVAKNWFGPGNTAVYGEYGHADDYARFVAANITDTSGTFWGLGINQKIDAAAMEMFISYRSYEQERTAAGVTATGNLDLIHAGARIQF